MGRDVSQGQFPGNQHFQGQGPNQMQGQMQGQHVPGQPGRDSQFGMQGNQNQGLNQQNFPLGQQQPNQGGNNKQQGMPGNMNQMGNNQMGNVNRQQQNQFGGGNFGYGMEGGYGGSDFSQWQNMGQMQGQNQGQGQDFRSNQFPGNDDSSQSRYPNQQGGPQVGQNTMGRDGQFPFRQQQFPGQGVEAGQKPDNFCNFNQQGGYGQEGMQQGSDNNNRFPNRDARPGPPDLNRGGILPLPVAPGQTDEQPSGRQPDPKGQMPRRPGPGSRGTPDDHSRSPSVGRSDSQPPMDQWPGMSKGQDQRRPGGRFEEGYPYQGIEGGEGYPPRGGDRFAPRDNMQQGEFAGESRGRGILPTPNMPAGHQTGYGSEPFNALEGMEQEQWPGYGGGEQGGRGGMGSDRPMGTGRDMRQDPDFREQETGRGPGQFREGDSDFRGQAQGGGRFDGPEGGMGFEGGLDGMGRGPGNRQMERGPDGRPFDRGFGGRSVERGPDGRPFERGPDSRPAERGPDGGPFERGPDSRPFEREQDGRFPDRNLSGRQFEGDQDRSLERGSDGRPLDRGSDGRPIDRSQDRTSLEQEEERDTDGRPYNRLRDRGSERGPFGGPEERPFDAYRGRYQDDGGFERGSRFDPAGERFDSSLNSSRFDSPHDRSRFDGPPDRSRFDAPGRRFDGPSDRPGVEGQPDERFPLHDTYDPMDMDIDTPEFEEPGGRLPEDRRYPDRRDLAEQDRGFEERGGRGFDRNEGHRGRGGFDRGRGRGSGRDFSRFRDEGYPEYTPEGFDNREEMRAFGDDYDDQYPGDRDFDSRRDTMRGRGGAPYGRGFGMDGRGRMDGPRGRMERGRGRFDGGPGRDFDTDRRRDGPNREEMDFRGRDRYWPDMGEEQRGAGKGLLGDAPVGLLPVPSPGREEDRDSRSSLQRDGEPPRDRDRRSYSDRRDREDRDRGREDRFGRRTDRRRSRDRSPDRDRHSRRSDRDRDRSDRRDRDRDRDRERDRSSHNRDRDSRSKDSVSKDSSSKDSNAKETSSKDAMPREVPAQKIDGEKDSGKTEQKATDQKQADSNNSQLQESKYIHVQGFPTGYNYREIRRFFFGCELPFDGIKIINDIKGQRTGQAYLKFANEETAKRAMRKNGETVFGKPVILSLTSDKVFESQIDSQTPPSSNDDEHAPSGPVPVVKKDLEKGSLIVMIKGLPFDIKREDVMRFFSTVRIADNGDAVFIEYDIRNQATGVAYLEAASVQDFKTAMGYDGRVFANRTLKVSVGRREEMDMCIKKQQEMFQRQANRMGDQQQQQQQHNIGPGIMGPRPALMGPGPARPGGPQPLMNLNPMNMPVIPPRNGPAFDPGFAMQRQQQQQQPPPPQPQHGDKPPTDQSQSFCVHIQGLPMLASYKDILEFFSGLEVVPNRGVQIVHDGMGKPMGEGFVEFASQEDKDKALKKDKTSMGRHILAVKSVAKGDMIERMRNARFVGLPPGQGPPGPPNFPPNMPEPSGGSMRPIPPGVLNRHWSYLSCQNFPPAVSIQEIMGFFQGFNPLPESIRLHYAADGSPTGNAVVGFMKVEDANRALQEMNGKRCRQNVVSLMPAM